MLWFLQISVSLLFFANKVYVLAGKKKVGWFLGATAALLGVFYFSFIHLKVYTTLEVGLIVLMGYGSFKKEKKDPRVEMAIRIVLATTMIALAVFAFSGFITIVELASSLCILAGTYFLTHQKVHLGWGVYLVGHALAAYLGFNKHQAFFADFQVASAIVSLVGLTKE